MAIMENSNTPLVSIVVPSYNHANYIGECIESIISQDYDNVELIVIDDGSKDCSVLEIEKMRAACEARFVRFEFRSRPNIGLSATLNEAFEWCNGEFFAPIASDDALLPNKTTLQVAYLINNPRCAAVFGGVQLMNEKSADIGRKRRKRRKHRTFCFKSIFLHNHSLPASTQMLRKSVLSEVGGYDINAIVEDWYMWLVISFRGYTLDNIGVPVARYRMHNENISKRFSIMAAQRKYIIDLFSSHELYDRAISNALIVSAAEFQTLNRRYALQLFVAALKISPIEVFRIKTLRLIINFFR